MINWQFTPAQAGAPADEWLPRQLRLCWGGPSGDSGPSGGGPSGDTGGSFFSSDGGYAGPGDYTGGSPSSFDAGAGFYSSDSGSFQSTDGGSFQSTDGSGSQPAGYSDGGYSYSDGGSNYSGDTGGYYSYSGTDGGAYTGGDTSGGYLGGSSLGGNVAADAGGPYGGAGGGPFGGPTNSGFGTPGGFADSTTGQGFGLFGQNQQGDLPAGTLDALINSNAMPTINIAAPYEGPLAGPDVMAGGRGPSLDTQLGINDIGNQQAQQAQQQQSDPLANYFESGMQVQTNDPTNAWQQAVNTVSQLNIDPQAQMMAAQELGRQNEGVPTSGRGGVFFDSDQGRARSGMDMEFNPFGTYQAPAQDQGRQGSLMDMLGPTQAQAAWQGGPNFAPTGPYGPENMTLSPEDRAAANQLLANTMNQTLVDPAITAYELGQQGRAGANISGQVNTAGKGDYFGPFTPTSPQQANELNTTTLSDLAAQYGRDPAQITSLLNNAPYEGPLGGPDVVGADSRAGPYAGPLAGPDVVGSREQAQPQQDTFSSRFGDIQQQSQDARPGWDIGQQLAGGRGGAELFAQAPQNVQQALQEGNPYGQMPYAAMPWGTTLAQPQLSTVDPSTVAFNNFLTQTQNQPPAPWNELAGKTLDQLRTELQPPVTRADVPLPVADPRSRGERGPQDIPLQQTRAPVVEREAPTARVTVTPARSAAPTQTQSRSAANTSRGQLDSLLNAARTAPTLAGRIAALDQLNGIISAMRAAGLPNPYGRDPDPGINAALRMGR